MRVSAKQRGGKRIGLVPAILVLAALLLVPASAAGSSIYWTNAGNIGRAGIDGSGVNQAFIADKPTTYGVTSDARFVYWTNYNESKIGRANLDGSGANPSFINGLSSPTDAAVSGQFIYWTNTGTNSIGRANLDGSGADPSFIPGALSPGGLAVDSQHLYWANINSIGRANLDGSGVDQAFVPGLDEIGGLDVDAQHLYWARYTNARIARANLNGSGVEANFIPVAGHPYGVAVDGQHIFWSNTSEGKIARADLNGSNSNPNFITGTTNPLGIHVDSLPHRSATTLACAPSSLTLPAASTCTVTIEDEGPFSATPGPTAPTGTVAFTTNSGSFAPAPSCALVSTGTGRSACQVTLTPGGPGAVAVGANYPGDTAHTGSNALVALTVNAPPVPALPIAKPSNKFRRAKPMLNLKKGIAKIPVTVPSPGKLVLTGKKLVFCAKQAKAPGAKINLLAIPKKTLRATLKETGSAKVAFKVTFTPIGGEPRTENGSVKLRLQ